MDNIEIRSDMNVRVENMAERTVTGIAVPYEVEAHGEVFARDAVTLDSGAKLFWNHDEPIGSIIDGRHTPDGFEITARVSETSKGNDVLAMLRDGTLDKFSVGFQLRGYEMVDGIRRVTDALVRETSVVVWPWYSDANITGVRNEQNSDGEPASDEPDGEPASAEQKGENMENTTPVVPDTAEVRELSDAVAHIERRMSEIEERNDAPAGEAFNSLGEYLRSLANGEEMAVRVYDGQTTANAIVTPIDRYLDNLVADASPFSRVFASGVTPATGMSIVYGKITAITDGTADQGGEGEDLGLYSLDMDTDSVNIKTVGSAIKMSRQAATRATVPFLDTHFRGQALALGKALNDELRSAYLTVHAAQVTATNTVAVADPTSIGDWIGAAVDASTALSVYGLQAETLVVSTGVFKTLASLIGTDGRPLMAVVGGGQNVGGSISVPGISGNLAGINVVVDAVIADDECAFVNSAALRQYQSAALRLSDSDAVALTEAWSLSTFTAVADEVPGAIVPVVID